MRARAGGHEHGAVPGVEGKDPTALVVSPTWGRKPTVSTLRVQNKFTIIFLFFLKTFSFLFLSSHKTKLSISVKVARWYLGVSFQAFELNSNQREGRECY